MNQSPTPHSLSVCFSSQSCQPFAILWTVAGLAPLSMEFTTGMGSHSLLQGIFQTQRSNPGLWHFRQILYHLSHQGRLTSCSWMRFVSISFCHSSKISFKQWLTLCKWHLFSSFRSLLGRNSVQLKPIEYLHLTHCLTDLTVKCFEKSLIRNDKRHLSDPSMHCV